ncbi:MAG: RsmG family class I SAM-dependent methyltransferase [Acidimicrobiia bacterium]
MDPGRRAGLLRVLERARAIGLLGPGPVEPHVEHALAFGLPVPDLLGGGERALGGAPAVDLGTGAGLPGLVLASAFAKSSWLLVDGRERSTRFVAWAVTELGLGERVAVRTARAEDLGREVMHRGRHHLVVARGFGAPAVVAECAAPLLAVGGRLVVSEPPEPSDARWRSEPLAGLGLALDGRMASAHASVAAFTQVRPCAVAYPRRTGVPAKRPLWGASPDPDVSRETPRRGSPTGT